ERTPNRAMLRAVGFGDQDFTKPIIGIANAHSTITPCNAKLNDLALRAEAAVRAAGGMPQTFGTITVSDGISMGTEGMKYSLVSREVIADSIETVCNAQCVDGVLAVGGCDKNMPGALIAIARMNIPAVFVYGGTIKPGHYKGQDLTVVSALEADGQYSARKLSEADLLEVERRACPGAGHGRPARARRLRDGAGARAGAVRPEALGPIRGHRLARGGRRAAGDEDPAGPRAPARRRGDDLGPDHRGGAAGRAGRAAQRPGRDPAVGPTALPAGTPRGAARQPGVGRRRREDHGDQTPEDDRPGARV